MDGKIVQFPLDKKVAMKDAWIDTDQEIEFDVGTFGDSMEPIIKVASIGK